MTTNTCCNYEKTTEDLNRRLSVKQLMELQDQLNNLIEGTGWVSTLSRDHLMTAIIDESAEVLGSNTNWAWWKVFKDPSAFDDMIYKLEVTDIAFFYLSIMIIQLREGMKVSGCPVTDEFGQWDFHYVGTDRGNSFGGIGLLCGSNNLDHSNFIDLIRHMIIPTNDIFESIDVLDRIVSSGGMDSILFSGAYLGKHTLNTFRKENPDWDKIDEAGVEDVERLAPLILAFYEDSSMTLDQLKQNVVDEFFEEATP